MRNVISIAARWVTVGFAILTGIGFTILGLIFFRAGLNGGGFAIALAFVFFVPALFTLFGGSIKWMRWLWGGMSVLGLATLFFPDAKRTGVATIILSVLFFGISFCGRDKRVEEEEDVSAFS